MRTKVPAPTAECIFRGGAENLEADVEERLDTVPVPSHPLLFHYALRKDLVDSRFDKASRDSQPIAAAYFAGISLGQKLKLHIPFEKLLIISQRFFGIPPFRYALADGIKRILSQTSFDPPQQTPPSLQMELLLGWQAAKF